MKQPEKKQTLSLSLSLSLSVSLWLQRRVWNLRVTRGTSVHEGDQMHREWGRRRNGAGRFGG